MIKSYLAKVLKIGDFGSNMGPHSSFLECALANIHSCLAYHETDCYILLYRACFLSWISIMNFPGWLGVGAWIT